MFERNFNKADASTQAKMGGTALPITLYLD